MMCLAELTALLWFREQKLLREKQREGWFELGDGMRTAHEIGLTGKSSANFTFHLKV